jgi:ADP-heptose:LPS heptosyltransferase
MKRVLLLRPGGLGDLIITLPSIRFLRRLHPGAALHLAARPEYAAVLAAAGVVDGILDLDDRAFAPFFSEEGGGPDSLPGGAPSALWSWFSNPPAPSFSRAAAALVPGGAHILVADPRRALPLSRDLFERTAASAGLTVGEDDFENCAGLPSIRPPSPLPFGRLFAVVHSGSGGSNKRWPFERFLFLIRGLAERGIPGILVTGPAEDDGAEERGRAPLPPGWQRRLSPPLIELAGWLSACLIYIGNDSGVTHLAAAAGARTLAFFLDAHLPAWKPFGRVTVLHAARIEGISLEEAREAALALLPG